MSYEVLSHTADTGIVAWGATRRDLFLQAAEGMFSLMYEPTRAPTRSVEVAVRAESIEDLLVEWLSELLYLSESKEIALESFEIRRFEDGRLEGRASGTSFDRAVLIGPPVKAVTYHQLEIQEEPDGFRARVIFDV